MRNRLYTLHGLNIPKLDDLSIINGDQYLVELHKLAGLHDSTVSSQLTDVGFGDGGGRQPDHDFTSKGPSTKVG
jgi:hypothetical protein